MMGEKSKLSSVHQVNVSIEKPFGSDFVTLNKLNYYFCNLNRYLPHEERRTDF
jgi:hypothetical protein